MSKLVYIAFFLLPMLVVGQKDSTREDHFKYLKEQGYVGPTEWNADSPPSMREQNPSTITPNQGGGNLSQDRLEDLRDYEDEYGEGGDLPEDPEVKDADPLDLPDFDAPEIDAPDINLPEIDAPTFSENFWKVILIIILSVAAILVVYLIIKNWKPRDKNLAEKKIDLEWNPETISKTELELRLEKALADKNYREGVRIYFTFILKELIRKNWIFWRNEKTNYDYLLEMGGKTTINEFREVVRIYDLIWYGEYEINEAIFAEIEPKFKNYYQQLSKE